MCEDSGELGSLFYTPFNSIESCLETGQVGNSHILFKILPGEANQLGTGSRRVYLCSVKKMVYNSDKELVILSKIFSWELGSLGKMLALPYIII
jgi:hypothetical protein